MQPFSDWFYDYIHFQNDNLLEAIEHEGYRAIMKVTNSVTKRAFLAFISLWGPFSAMDSFAETSSTTERYVALGDSYTIGEGVAEDDRWPNQLVSILSRAGLKIELVANPARSGWTTEDLLRDQIPVLRKSHPSFVTLLVGVNDFVRGVDEKSFRSAFARTVAAIQETLPDKRKLLLVTIPDYFLTPAGGRFARGLETSDGINTFNKIINEEACKAGVLVADINPVSKRVRDEPSLTSADGLHPSASQYRLWAEVISEKAKKLLAP